MIPVFQTIVDPKIGDCLRAATASIFDLKLEQVPNFMMFEGRKWFTVFWYFLLALGYEYHSTYHLAATEDKEQHRKFFEELEKVDGHCICSVPSSIFKGTHAVVVNQKGIIAHDPNLNQSYLGTDIFKIQGDVFMDVIKKKELKEVLPR